MTILNYYASGGPDIRLFTLELTCQAWTAQSNRSHYGRP